MNNISKLKSSILLFILLLLLIPPIYSQNRQSISKEIGDIENWSKNERELIITTSTAKIEIRPFSAEIIRIRVSMESTFSEDFSYAVINGGTKVKWTIEDRNTSFWVHTDSIDMEIIKIPFSLKYYNKKGKEILSNNEFGHFYSGNELACYNRLFPDERFIGLGEKGGNLDKRGNGYTNWNTDCFGYTSDTDPLYSSIPFYVGIHDSLVYGMFLDQSTKSHFNFGASNNRFSSFSVEAPEIRYFYIAGSSVSQIINNYTSLTGRMPMPPKWSLGYHQSRWSYFPENKVLNIAKTFREKEIPLDVIHLDIHYMDNYKIFTWDKSRFPDPPGMIKKLKDIGVNLTVIIDPGIKVDNNYNSFLSGIKENVFLKYNDGSIYSGSVWPGVCHFPDFTIPQTRSWWARSFKTYTDAGVTGFWNDMNEPATWGQNFPSNVKFGFEGKPGFTIDGRNIYGLEMARATYEGVKQLMDKRPFVLTRSGFAGLQRYTAIWTGDNTANEDHLLLGIRLVNSLGLSGVAFAGTDVGGFNGETSNSLYARWISIGAFTPFFRGHKMINMKDSEPWAFGEETEEIGRNYIKLRYKLMPYIYSCFHEASLNGMPVARSLAINYPFDSKIYQSEYQHQYMFGPSIMIAPSKSTESFTDVYLPKGNWYNLYSGEIIKGDGKKAVSSPIYKLPAFVKASSIIPAQKALYSISKGIIDTLDIHIYKGIEANTFILYEDDGTSFDYEKNNFYKLEISYFPSSKLITLDKLNDGYIPTYKTIRLLLHSFGDNNRYTLNNKIIQSKKIKFSWLDLYKHLYYAPNESELVDELIFNNNEEMITIKIN